MVEREKSELRKWQDKVCGKGPRRYCDSLRNASSRDFLIAFITLLVIVIVRIFVFGALFGFGILPVYYMYFPLMIAIEVGLLVVEGIILFRKTGLFALIMLLHLLIFIPVVAVIAFIPWSLVGLLLYGIFGDS